MVPWGSDAYILRSDVRDISSEFRLFRYILLIVSVMYTAFSFSRPDRIIAEYNISSTENLNFEDVQYLITGLSEDAAPSIAEISSDELSELEVIEYVEIIIPIF